LRHGFGKKIVPYMGRIFVKINAKKKDLNKRRAF
jgi:hypothetical protein